MDSPWSRRMRARYGFGFMACVVVLLSMYVYIRLKQPVSCFDHMQNQNEVGVDCGGVCDLACTKTTRPLSTEWALPFEVSPGWWSALAYVQNPNSGMYAEQVPYLFTLYDAQGNTITKQQGSTFIWDETTVPIFLGRIAMPHASTSIARISFSWLQEPVWKQVHTTHVVRAEQIQELSVTHGAEVSAVIRNTEPVSLRNITAVVVVYGAQNALAVSETYIDVLPAYGSRRVSFVWPEPFSAPVGRIEVFPRVSPNQQ